MQNYWSFKGLATALITPFKDGNIDYPALAEIIERQISAGIETLVALGTTGESCTLTERERYEVYRFVTEHAVGRARVILGTGSNDTRRAQEYTKEAERIGADGALVITPYYNKGTEDGIIYHYKKIANSTNLPIILYNVPSRTGVNLSISAIEELANEENIVAIKEASDGIERQMSLYTLADKIAVFCGNDSQIYLNLSLGGSGSISVLSNLLPKEALAIYKHWESGSPRDALKEQMRLMPIIRALFTDTSPSPVKYAMHLLGMCTPELRLPLTEPTAKTRAALAHELSRLGYAQGSI